ncbi:MAG: hypothetical protein N3G78_02875 [Desulfobacterota bacterium]|nr:hypothetical protein [Thermodesulfobacteriota bacterium]
MDVERFLETAKTLDRKRKGKKEVVEEFKKCFERFRLVNRAYLDKETYEKAQGSISSMAEAMANTLRYLEGEISRLRHKGRRQPFEDLQLAEMQKVQKRNEMLLKELLS